MTFLFFLFAPLFFLSPKKAPFPFLCKKILGPNPYPPLFLKFQAKTTFETSSPSCIKILGLKKIFSSPPFPPNLKQRRLLKSSILSVKKILGPKKQMFFFPLPFFPNLKQRRLSKPPPLPVKKILGPQKKFAYRLPVKKILSPRKKFSPSPPPSCKKILSPKKIFSSPPPSCKKIFGPIKILLLPPSCFAKKSNLTVLFTDPI